MTRELGLVLLAGAVIGCSQARGVARDASSDHPGTQGDPRAALCPPGDAAATAITYGQIQELFNQNCVSCHSGGSDPALNLTSAVSWNTLVNQPAPAPDTCGGLFVVPGNPGESYLFQKLSSASPCYGAQMPKGEFFSMPLPACLIAMVNEWISEGAPGPAADGG